MGIASLGTVRYNDAFGVAFKLPNLFRRLFGEGALASAFVPVLPKYTKRKASKRQSFCLPMDLRI